MKEPTELDRYLEEWMQFREKFEYPESRGISTLFVGWQIARLLKAISEMAEPEDDECP